MWLHSAGYSAAAVRQLPQVGRITLCNVLQVLTRSTQLQPAGMQSQSNRITYAVAAAYVVADVAPEPASASASSRPVCCDTLCNST
jgi:hypothetical protein